MFLWCSTVCRHSVSTPPSRTSSHNQFNRFIIQVLSDVPLVFHRVEALSPKAALEDRFTYFTQKIIPSFM